MYDTDQMSHVFTALSVGLLLTLWLFYRWLHSPRPARAVRAGEPPRVVPLGRYPSLTVIRPIKGLDTGATQNIFGALAHAYPGEVETLFVLDDEAEPAVPIVRDAITFHRRGSGRGEARLIFCGQPPAGRTGKLNAMIVGLAHARGELVAFADSDIRPAPEALTRLVETLLSDERSGAAFSPVVSALPPETLGDAGYALLINGLYGAAARSAAASNAGALPFIMGQLMVLRREAIDEIGGLSCAEGQLVDDMYIGAQIYRAGRKNLVAPLVTPIIQQGLGLRAFRSLYRRWIAFGRSGLPGWDFKIKAAVHGVIFWVGVLAAAGAAALGLPLAALISLAPPLLVVALINALHTELGGKPLRAWHAWAPAGLLLVAPLIFLSLYGKRQVTWRGRTYALDLGSRLAAGPSPAGRPEVPAGDGAAPTRQPTTETVQNAA